MKPISLKAGLIVTLLLASTGFLTACTTPTQNQTQTQKQSTDPMPGMDHSNMNHNMAMDLGSADAEYDLRFIDGMTMHHQGAIEMAKSAQEKSTRPEIKQLAADIIKAQEKEIEQLKNWRKTWYPQASSTPMAYNAQMGHTMEMTAEQKKSMMMDVDLGEANTEFDLRFINAMIPHHEGAVTMAQDALTKTKHSEIRQLSQDIINSQQKEIQQMKQWRQSWYKIN